MKQTQDIAAKDDAVEAGVIELDILGELIHKELFTGISFLGQWFWRTTSIKVCPWLIKKWKEVKSKGLLSDRMTIGS